MIDDALGHIDYHKEQMRAVLCRDFSGPDHLELGEATEPQPAEDET